MEDDKIVLDSAWRSQKLQKKFIHLETRKQPDWDTFCFTRKEVQSKTVHLIFESIASFVAFRCSKRHRTIIATTADRGRPCLS